MSDKIVIEGIPAYDGTYELDMDYFTMRELHQIKQLSGIRLGEIPDGLRAWDSDLLLAFAAVALTRAGKQVDPDLLWDAQSGSISFEVGDARPPEQPTNASNETSPASPISSGSASGNGSENPATGPSPTGEERSGVSSGPATSVTSP